jgi:hypothetical protein
LKTLGQYFNFFFNRKNALHSTIRANILETLHLHYFYQVEKGLNREITVFGHQDGHKLTMTAKINSDGTLIVLIQNQIRLKFGLLSGKSKLNYKICFHKNIVILC